jgi:hypothetical protein
MFWQPGGPEVRWEKRFSDPLFRICGGGRFSFILFSPREQEREPFYLSLSPYGQEGSSVITECR